MISIDFILLNLLILLVISFLIYNRNRQLPNFRNNVVENKFEILKSIGISFLIVIPLIFIQIYFKKNLSKYGITSPIKI
jgi:hypothetical protein